MLEEIEEQLEEPPSTSLQERIINFRNKFYKDVPDSQWNDYRWQMKNRIVNYEHLTYIINLTDKENTFLNSNRKQLPLAITPYYLSLVDLENTNDPIRKCVVPRIEESIESFCESEDPLGETHQSPVACIVHRYPDRALFLATTYCSTSCRYCTRSRLVEDKSFLIRQEWDKGFEYIRNNKQIRDVIISGGDPLCLSDSNLEYILSNIRKIEHVEVIRIGTKVPVVMPQRVTKKLVKMLSKYHPLYMSIHFTHPNELTEECKQACSMLANVGIPLGSQTVLLKDVNDKTSIMKKLFTGLMKFRIKPYYTYICDKVKGSSHFRTNVQTGIDIFRELQGNISGYAIPKLIIDIPNGGGKVPVQYNYYIEETRTIENYEGKVSCYYNE
jgi:lysine 2,3-aminomutase